MQVRREETAAGNAGHSNSGSQPPAKVLLPIGTIICSKITEAFDSPYFRNMFRQIGNWRTLLALIAILIVSGTIWYSSYLARQIVTEEKQKVESWIAASQALLDPENTNAALPFKIIQFNDDIPIIETNERDSITAWVNLDTGRVRADTGFLRSRLADFKSENPPIQWISPADSTRVNNYY